jgi:hypothetical protein
LARRDQLTYDVEEPRRQRPVPLGPLLLLVAVLAVSTLLVLGVVTSIRAPHAAPPPVTAPATAVGTPAPSAGPTTAVPSGSDADEGLGAPDGSAQAARAFVAAWLEQDPAARKQAVEQVSVPALAEGLMLTDPANIPRATPRGAPALDDASTYSVQFTQALSTGGPIRIYLVADPAARYGWLATSVERA